MYRIPHAYSAGNSSRAGSAWLGSPNPDTPDRGAVVGSLKLGGQVLRLVPVVVRAARHEECIDALKAQAQHRGGERVDDLRLADRDGALDRIVERYELVDVRFDRSLVPELAERAVEEVDREVDV